VAIEALGLVEIKGKANAVDVFSVNLGQNI